MTLARATLYGILDLGYIAVSQTADFARKMIAGGVDVVQLRAKKLSSEEFAQIAMELVPLFQAADIPFILNDHPELVESTGASGAHVGQDDLSVAEARQLAGPGAIIGKSTHSVAQAIAGAAEADYIGFGPLFATPTKPDYTPVGLDDIRTIHESTETPIFCIGGIKLDNLPTVLSAGARRVVIVSGLLQAPDVVTYCRAVRQLLPEL
ncbi:MAG: thiamine phosphate synthase [Chthoniobacterales bacterium]